jgi:hypothetical protein
MNGVEVTIFGLLVLIALVVIGALFFAFLTSERDPNELEDHQEGSLARRIRDS